MRVFSVLIGFLMLAACTRQGNTSLFADLPDCCPTPDGMAVAPDGTLILACPNYAEPEQPGCLMRLSPDGKAEKWLDIPVLESTGAARPMGIAFNEKGDLYVCDNQAWAGLPGTENKGRLLRLSFDDKGELTDMVTIASGM